MFRLLEPANSSTPSDAQYIEMLGKRWVICEYAKPSDAPVYTCISYTWGEEETKNLLNDRQSMSIRTIPAIEATIIASQTQKNWADNVKFSHNDDSLKEEAGQAASLLASQAFWIDALCVPFQEPARTGSLQSMGEIFSAAFQVIVVLTKQCTDVIHNISCAEKLDSSALFVLENEGWINRAWTYQEAVNSRSLYFVVADKRNAIVSGHNFLSAIVDAIEEYKELHNFDKISWVEQHRGLDNLEMLLADYLISDYEDRSAYQVMSVMEHRLAKRPEDYFYAMIGSITATSSKVQGEEKLHPSEYFLRVCERKGDYSFIYSAARRSEVRGLRWRPIRDRYSAVLPSLITFGNGEPGQHEKTHLRLDKMHRLKPGAINEDALKAAKWFMGPSSDGLTSDAIASGIFKRMKALGFTGPGEYLEFETGFFFPQSKLVNSNDFFVVVSCELNWVTGGPGLLLRSNNTDINKFCDVGAFVGRNPKSGEPINVG